jgi:hypothetical protein
MQPSDTGHVVVYWKAGPEETRLRRVLQEFPERCFWVHEFNRSSTWRNCDFQRPSAGFSLISECMHWLRKMLLLHLTRQREVI